LNIIQQERLDNVEGEKEKRLQKRDDNILKRKKGGVKIADPSAKGAASQKDTTDGDKGAKKSRGAGFEGKATPGFLNKQKQSKQQKGPATTKS
jgi:hypothetical protein